MAFRHLAGVLRSLAAHPGDVLSHVAAARAHAASGLLRPSPSPIQSFRALLNSPLLVRFASTERVPFEVQTGAEPPQDLNLEEPTGIFHIYEREEPDEKDEDDPGVPWGTISLTGPPPDHLSTNLSSKTKEQIYEKYKERPTEETVAQLASQFKILKQRVQAIVHLKEREEIWDREVLEQQDDETKELFKEIDDFYDEETVDKGGGERLWLNMSSRMKPKLVVENDDYEADSIVSTSGMSWDEASKRYEQAEYREFMERLKFNKKLMNKEVIPKAVDRKRPDEGWTYVVEELGKEGKRGKGGGKRFVAKADGSHRPLNELDKLMMKRETPKRRKFDFQ